MAGILLPLLTSGAAVIAAGILLGWSADGIANRTGLGELWTGWVMLAAVTSLPEFVTDVSAVRLNSVNLAAGDLFGSSLTNMAILAVITLLFEMESHNRRETSQTALSAQLAITLTAMGTCFTRLHITLGWMRIRAESLLILAVWLLGTRAMYQREHDHVAPVESDLGARHPEGSWTLRRSIVVFLIGSAIIFRVAPRFANFAAVFAEKSGLGDSFVGTLVLGFSTALPELVTSLTACRLGDFDLAVANLYGSCAFNMVVFFAMDLASPVSVFSRLEPVLTLSGGLAVCLMLLGLVTITHRRRLYLLPDLGGGILLASYGLAIWVVYAVR
jgi:cation:H+ antiporter